MQRVTETVKNNLPGQKNKQETQQQVHQETTKQEFKQDPRFVDQDRNQSNVSLDSLPQFEGQQSAASRAASKQTRPNDTIPY